jgi:hypothetical protein
MVALTGIAIGERIFRYSVERELLRDFAKINRIDEKRKMRPSYGETNDEDTAFELVSDAVEPAYRESAR